MRTALTAGARLMLVALLVIGCSDDDDKTTAPDDGTTPIIGTVTGVVYSRSGVLDGAAVTIGAAATFTNDDGYFALPGLDVGDAVVRVVDDGYASTYRNLSIREDETTHLARIVLLDAETTIVDAATGGSVASPDASATVALTGGSLVTPAGDPYSGMVEVEVSAARPEDPSFFDAFPGRFEGRFEDVGTDDDWQNWHNGEDTVYPNTGPGFRVPQK